MGSRLWMAVAVAVLGLAPLASGGTWTVAPAGVVADFDSVQDAVVAAASGDVILVSPGQYDDFSGLLVNKSLTVIGIGGSGAVTYSALPVFPNAAPAALVVADLPVGGVVRIAGIKFTSAPANNLAPTAVALSNCAGMVILSDVICEAGGTGFVEGQGSGAIYQCANVVMDRCEFTSATSASYLDDGQAGLYMLDSVVQMNSCTVSGADGSNFFSTKVTSGGPGIRAESSTLRIARSVVQGGVGGSESILLPTPVPIFLEGGPGIRAIGSTVHFSGGGQNQTQGGKGGLSTFGGGSFSAPGGAGVTLDGTSMGTRTKDALLAGGFSGDGTIQAGAVANQGAFLSFGEIFTTLAVDASTVPLGGTVAFEFDGEPSSAVFTQYSLGVGSPTTFPGIHGVSYLDLNALRALPTIVLGGTGTGQVLAMVPMAPVLVGVSVLVQGVGLSPAAVLSISAPAVVTIYN